MKVLHKTLAGLTLAGLIGTAVYAARPIDSVVVKPTSDERIIPSTAAMEPGFNYSTGFEAAEGFEARNPLFTYPPNTNPPSGWIRLQPNNPPAGPACGTGPYCWGTTTAANRSTREPHIDTVHPFGGVGQHLRISTDRTTRTNVTGFNVGIDARIPNSGSVLPRPNAPNTVSMEIAITNAFGMDYIVQPQHVGAGYRLTATMFYAGGGIYTIDSACGAVASAYMPFGIDGTQIGWAPPGACTAGLCVGGTNNGLACPPAVCTDPVYQNFTIGWDTCKGEVLFYYGGVRVFPACISGKCVGGRDNTAPCALNTDCRATCMWTPGTSTDQLLIYGDNFPGSSADIDNVQITMQDAASTPCGDHFISYGCGEQCEIGPGEDTNCPGRCLPDCTCSPICTANNPCPLVNGANGPYLTSSGFYTYNGSSPFVEIDDCGSTTRLGAVLDTSIGIPDVGGAIGYNDDCGTGQYGGGSDPNASCFGLTGMFNSCTCVPGGALTIEADSFGSPPEAGSSTIINVNKKVVCAGALAGACCDSNGHDGDPSGCTDNVASADCRGAFDTWYGNGKCAAIQCACIPDCTGRECGDDGCGGICLPNNCDDGKQCTDDSCSAAGLCVHVNNDANTCTDGLVCTINDHCVAGACVVEQRVCNDNNICNGVETCVEPTGCTNPPDLVCDDGLFCNGVEFCDPILGCQDGPDPCDPIREVCDEVNDVCKPAPIPTVSEWGMVALALLLLIGAKVYFGRRQATA